MGAIKNSIYPKMFLLVLLAALAIVLQVYHVGYESKQFGMWIDLVGALWLLGFFLFGIPGLLFISLGVTLIIVNFTDEQWIGAIMKWTLTMPMWLMLYLFCWRQRAIDYYVKFPRIILPLMIALICRSGLAIFLNYYYAIPEWYKLTPQAAFLLIPWYHVVGFNLVQGSVDVLFSWLIIFGFQYLISLRRSISLF